MGQPPENTLKKKPPTENAETSTRIQMVRMLLVLLNLLTQSQKTQSQKNE